MRDQPVAHIPVMQVEVVEMLKPQRHSVIFVDCTLGYGGHSAAITRDFDSNDTLIGIDRDAEAISFCTKRFQDAPFSVKLHQKEFHRLEEVLKEENVEEADRFLIDCGFSSPQVDTPARGFSFQHQGPLDMRMDQKSPLSAQEIVNSWDGDELTRIFKIYGEERFSRKIAREIVKRREMTPIETTQDLADVVMQAIPAKHRHQTGIHPATRVFQALRIVVNDELDSLRKGLNQALRHLAPGGRIAVISYHSLEHRIVKERFREFCGTSTQPLGPAKLAQQPEPEGSLLTKRAIKPCAAELEKNPRARSAQLRGLARRED